VLELGQGQEKAAAEVNRFAGCHDLSIATQSRLERTWKDNPVKSSTNGFLAVLAALASLPLATAELQAKPDVPSNLGPDKWVTCAAVIPGTTRHYYAWWNPGWPAPHNTEAAAIAICNQWHGGTGPAIPPAANTPHTGPHQYSPRIFGGPVLKGPAVRGNLPQIPKGGCGQMTGNGC
jgi:hypothetical protein